MAANLKLECGSCGATSMAPDGRNLWKCQYCGTVTIIDAMEVDPTADLKSNIARRTRKIESILRRPANFFSSESIADGGHIHVTRNEFVFVPHMLNIDSNYRLVFPFSDISDIWKESKFGIIRFLFVKTKDYEIYKFAVWNQNEVINCVNDMIID